jgi:hypothetical protein
MQYGVIGPSRRLGQEKSLLAQQGMLQLVLLGSWSESNFCSSRERERERERELICQY